MSHLDTKGIQNYQDAEGITKYYADRNKEPPRKEPPAQYEFEDDSQTGICLQCKEHSTPVYMKCSMSDEIIEDEEPISCCCGMGIELN